MRYKLGLLLQVYSGKYCIEWILGLTGTVLKLVGRAGFKA